MRGSSKVDGEPRRRRDRGTMKDGRLDHPSPTMGLFFCLSQDIRIERLDL